MEKQVDPSNPVNLDSGQREELTYIIESLKKNIRTPKKRDEGKMNPSRRERERGYASRGGWSLASNRHVAAVDHRNLSAIAEKIPA